MPTLRHKLSKEHSRNLSRNLKLNRKLNRNPDPQIPIKKRDRPLGRVEGGLGPNPLGVAVGDLKVTLGSREVVAGLRRQLRV